MKKNAPEVCNEAMQGFRNAAVNTIKRGSPGTFIRMFNAYLWSGSGD